MTLLEKIQKKYSEEDAAFLRQAYDYAAMMHKDQKRASGEPYFTHPCAVAEILVDLNLDAATVACGFLHDVVEDTDATDEDIRRRFGGEVMTLVEGVTKLDLLSFGSVEEGQAENLRKIFVAMAEDVRVIMVKLADRLHNMRSLNFLSKERQQRIARETLDIYAPLAGRLGMSAIRCELEDLCLKYLDPEAYEYLLVNIRQRIEDRQEFVDFVCSQIQDIMKDAGMAGEVFGRPKHFYSIYRKMRYKGKTLDQIYDLTAVRVIVKTVDECYELLGKIHNQWKPVPGRIKDYIATPKRNMYQSLHTTVVTNFGQFFEIQIRTEEMDRVAEYGIASHWMYKESERDISLLDDNLSWVKDLLDWQGALGEGQEFLDSIKSDLESSELLVFTPHGKVISLPRESTPVDFAYAIHTEIGDSCSGAKVNGKMTSLDAPLHTGDVVEIVTSSVGPSWEWLKIVKSSVARGKIRSYFKKAVTESDRVEGEKRLREAAREKGYNLDDLLTPSAWEKLCAKLCFISPEEMYSVVGYGAVGVNQVLYRLIDYKKKEEGGGDVVAKDVAIDSWDGAVSFANCCNPVPGDDIVGFLSKGRGAIVHRRDCANVASMEPERLKSARWLRSDGSFVAGIKVTSESFRGLTAFVTGEIEKMGLEMISISGRVNKERLDELDIKIRFDDIDSLEELSRRIRKDSRIKDVQRTSG